VLASTGCDAQSAGSSAPTAAAPACTVSGAKSISPALADPEICARFMAALRTGLPTSVAVSVQLSFKPQGLAEAAVTRTRAGAAPVTTSHALGASDRRFRAEDIDTLAREVLQAISVPPSQ
jgi:hypothetical protein